MLHNFTYWQEHLMELSMQGYEDALGVFVWPLIFCAIIGYVYVKQQSATAAAIVALILFAAFGNAMLNVPYFTSFIWIVVSLAMTGLFLVFFTKWRNR